MYDALGLTANIPSVRKPRNLVTGMLFTSYEHQARKSEDKRDRTWHTAFHGSNFPGNTLKNCQRQAMYGLLGVPHDGNFSAASIGIMDAGKDIELNFVRYMKEAYGILSPGPDEKQWVLRDDEAMLVGSPDVVVLDQESNRPYVVEIKTKDHDKVIDMRLGKISLDEYHRWQCLTYIHMVRLHHDRLFGSLDLKPCVAGSIIYASRNRPLTVCEFELKFDELTYRSCRDSLVRWRDDFMNDVLEERDKSWKWTEQPCDWCDFKKTCKQDYKDGVLAISDSCGISKGVKAYGDEDYSYETVKGEIRERWSVDD